MKQYLFLLFFYTLLSCSDKTENKYKVFRYNQENHITSLDPAFAKSQNNIWATHHLYNGLVKLDTSLNVINDLARDWWISEDGLTYTFVLRNDVYFHDSPCFKGGKGRKVIASDVEYSLKRIIDDDVASPGSWLFKGKVDSILPFASYGLDTFRLRLTQPFLPMMGILTMQYCSVVPKEAVEYYKNEFRSNPVGSGPFKFKRWVENQALYFTKNNAYFTADKVSYDGIKTLFIPDKKIAFLELLNGNLDYVKGLESSFINELLTREGQLKTSQKNKLIFKKAPFLNMEYFGFNLTALPPEHPFQIKEVRQALNYGIDKQLMLQALRNNVGKPANSGFVPFGLPSHNPDRVPGYFYDLQKARDLLKNAGYPNGKGFPEITLFTNKDYLDLSTFAVKQWERLGINIKIDVLESAILRDGMRKATIPFFRASWIADYPDSESFLCMFYSKNPPPPNYTRYISPEFDKLYDLAIKESDTEKRISLYQEMDRILVEDAPVIFLFYDESANFYNSRISGIETNAINQLEVESLQIAQEKLN